jgi:hypothetical protein
MRVVKIPKIIAKCADKRKNVVFQIDHDVAESLCFESSRFRLKTRYAVGDTSNGFDSTMKIVLGANPTNPVLTFI